MEMFGLPEAKRVRRAHIFATDENEGSGEDTSGRITPLASNTPTSVDKQPVTLSQEAQARLLNIHLGLSLAPLTHQDLNTARPQPLFQTATSSDPSDNPAQGQSTTHPEAAPVAVDDAGEASFNFRLFTQTGAQKVEARHENEIPTANLVDIVGDDENCSGGLAWQRPASAYIAGPVSDLQRACMQHSAVGAADVRRRAGRPDWGMAMSWRIIHVNMHGDIVAGANAALTTAKDDRLNNLESKGQQRRTRPGKKLRIARRKRGRAEAEKARIRDEARQRLEQERETRKLEKQQHLAEKKKRMNRTKKLRKRAKKKQGALNGVMPDGLVSATSSDSDK